MAWDHYDKCMFQCEIRYLKAKLTIYHPGDRTGNVNERLGSFVIGQEMALLVTFVPVLICSFGHSFDEKLVWPFLR